MWERSTFLRPTAHRGLHNESCGVIENTWPAFDAAIKGGFGIECDLQSTKDNIPVVFHDFTLDRLMEGSGRLADINHARIKTLSYKDQNETILSFAALLERVAGRTPLLVDLKSHWSTPNLAWLKAICVLSQNYQGPLALMSLDPDIMCTIQEIAPGLPRGLVSGMYRHPERDPWYPELITPERAAALSNLSDIDTVRPDFIAYHVKDLACPSLQAARQKQNLPIFTWTVRSDEDWQMCHTYADAAIFEGIPR